MLCTLVHVFSLFSDAVRVNRRTGPGINSIRVNQDTLSMTQLNQPTNNCWNFECFRGLYADFGGHGRRANNKNRHRKINDQPQTERKNNLPRWFIESGLGEYCESLEEEPLGNGLDSTAYLVKLEGPKVERDPPIPVEGEIAELPEPSQGDEALSQISHPEANAATPSAEPLPAENVSDGLSSERASEGGVAKFIVVKQLKDNEIRGSAGRKAKHEYELLMYLASLENQYIVRVVPALNLEQTGRYGAIFLEYANGNDLKTFWMHAVEACNQAKENRLLAFFECWRARAFEFVFFLHALKGLQGLHLKDLVHMDLKFENIMLNFVAPEKPLTNFGAAMLIDFGFAQWQRTGGGVKGTFLYMAPEVWQRNNIGHRGHDMWSMGIILYMLIFHKLPMWYFPFRNKNFTDEDIWKKMPRAVTAWAKDTVQQDKNFKNGLPDHEHVPSAVLSASKALLEKLLQFSYEKRLEVHWAIEETEAVIQHWIHSLRSWKSQKNEIMEYNSETVRLIETMLSKPPAEYDARLPFPSNVPTLKEPYNPAGRPPP